MVETEEGNADFWLVNGFHTRLRLGSNEILRYLGQNRFNEATLFDEEVRA